MNKKQAEFTLVIEYGVIFAKYVTFIFKVVFFNSEALTVLITRHSYPNNDRVTVRFLREMVNLHKVNLPKRPT